MQKKLHKAAIFRAFASVFFLFIPTGLDFMLAPVPFRVYGMWSIRMDATRQPTTLQRKTLFTNYNQRARQSFAGNKYARCLILMELHLLANKQFDGQLFITTIKFCHT